MAFDIEMIKKVYENFSTRVDAARKVVDGLKLVRPAVSLGGPETLICHPASSTHVGVTPEDQVTAGITQGLLRVSVGLESTADLIADFHQVLASL